MVLGRKGQMPRWRFRILVVNVVLSPPQHWSRDDLLCSGKPDQQHQRCNDFWELHNDGYKGQMCSDWQRNNRGRALRFMAICTPRTHQTADKEGTTIGCFLKSVRGNLYLRIDSVDV